MNASAASNNTDFAAIKAKQQQTWSAGDYAAVGTTLQIVGEQLCETIDLKPGSRVLDVAAGNGNATLAAARRFCEVVSTDYVDELLKKGQARAQAEGLTVTFQVADAEALPFPDAEFDVVLSTFGVMFTPDHARAARELIRVTRSGGCIGLANWTPEGFIGQLFQVIGRQVPPAQGLKSPSVWGTRDMIEHSFNGVASSIEIHARRFTFRYRSAEHFLTYFRDYYGPVQKAYAALGERADELDRNIRSLLARMNVATNGTLAVPSDYIEVVVHKR